MPTLLCGRFRDSEDVVGFRFTSDRRRYLDHVVPFRERRAGYPTRRRASFESDHRFSPSDDADDKTFG
jgi:hypothetical protein